MYPAWFLRPERPMVKYTLFARLLFAILTNLKDFFKISTYLDLFRSEIVNRNARKNPRFNSLHTLTWACCHGQYILILHWLCFTNKVGWTSFDSLLRYKCNRLDRFQLHCTCCDAMSETGWARPSRHLSRLHLHYWHDLRSLLQRIQYVDMFFIWH